MTLDEIVEDYIRYERPGAREEMQEFADEDSLSAAIRRAALCKTKDGKRHQHQRRIPGELLEDVEARLQSIRRKLSNAKNFAVLHDFIENEIGELKGIGELTAYDIAHRIGASLRKSPTLVYLHRGTREGAAILGFRGRTLDSAMLPAAFSRLTPAEIEDCLCIYKNELRSEANRPRRKAGCGIPLHRRRLC